MVNTILGREQRTVRRRALAGYRAFGWVVLFFGFHLYWYLGGAFASPGKLPGEPRSLLAWAFQVLVGVAFPLGAFVCLAIARGWAAGAWPSPARSSPCAARPASSMT
jgi:hypothetical protein